MYVYKMKCWRKNTPISAFPRTLYDSFGHEVCYLHNYQIQTIEAIYLLRTGDNVNCPRILIFKMSKIVGLLKFMTRTNFMLMCKYEKLYYLRARLLFSAP